MVSSEGGMEIEEVAKTSPENCTRSCRPVLACPVSKGDDWQNLSGLKVTGTPSCGNVSELYTLYREMDASIVEINPLVVTEQGALVALDAKMNFDGNALYMHSDVVEMRDLDEEDRQKLPADAYNLNYIKLDGEVGCMVSGAGLAMATMDIIKQAGGSPANFLDVGGGANVETAKNGFRIILADENVKAVLINIFGGLLDAIESRMGLLKP